MESIPLKQFRLAAGVVLALGLVWIGISATLPGTTTNSGIPAPQAGFLAPDFSLTTLEGTALALSDFQGKAVLVNVWASWCSPCRAEMPAMQRTFEDYEDLGFTILAVNAATQDNRADAEAFIEEMGLTFPILFDTDGYVYEQYQISALPSSFFILPDGSIQEVVFGGPMAEALLKTRVESLLEEVN
jgi:peroxiredoxin